MQPQLEVLESRLAAVLMSELVRPRDLGGDARDADDTFVDIILDDLEIDDSGDYYASYELVSEPSPAINEASPTIEFVRVRDTTHDHVITVRFGRAAIDPDTLPVPKYSAPYELIDIQDSSVKVVADPEPSPASSVEIVDIVIDPEPAAVVVAEPSAADEFFSAYRPQQPLPLPAPPPALAHFTAIPTATTAGDALQFPLYSAPYERVELQDRSHAFVKATLEPEVVQRPSVEWFAAEPTDIITDPPRTSRLLVGIAMLLCALTAVTIGLGIALLMR